MGIVSKWQESEWVVEATTDAWSVKNTLLHGVLQTFTCNFLAPFRQCLEALYEEAVVPKRGGGGGR